MDDTIKKLQIRMDLSQMLGAPVEGIPKKAVAVIDLIGPYLINNTTPREAAIVIAAVFAYFAALLTRDTGGDRTKACEQAHQLLDAAINIVGEGADDLDLGE